MIRNLVLSMLLAVPAFAGVIYVDDDGSDDSGSGTIGSPYGTIQKAADLVQPGDTVYVREGIYREAVLLKTAAAHNNRIVFSAYPGETPVLDGSDPLTGWTKCTSAADCGGNPNWENIWYADRPSNLGNTGTGLYEDNVMLKLARYPDQPDPLYNDQIEHMKNTTDGNATTISLTDADVFNQADAGFWDGADIWVYGGNQTIEIRSIEQFEPDQDRIRFANAGFVPEKFSVVNHLSILDRAGEFVVDATRDKVFLWPFDQGSPSGGRINIHARKTGFQADRMHFNTIQGFTIRNFSSISGGSLEGLGIRAVGGYVDTTYNLHMKDNTIYNIEGRRGIYLDRCKNCVVERNEIHDNRCGGIGGNRHVNVLIQNNTVYRTTSTAIGCLRSTGLKVIGNYTYDCNGHHGNGITFYLDCTNMTVIGNRVINCNVGLTYYGVDTVLVANNIFDGGGTSWPVACWNPSITSNVTFVHNISINSGSHRSGFWRLNNGTISNLVVKNNILHGMEWQSSSAEISNNIYTMIAPTNQKVPAETGSQILINGDALLLNDYKNGDYTLKAGCAAIDAGVDVGFAWDIDSTARPYGSAPDIGCYEWNGTAITDLQIPVIDAGLLPNPVKPSVVYNLRSLSGDLKLYTPAGAEVTGKITSGIYLYRAGDEAGLKMITVVE